MKTFTLPFSFFLIVLIVNFGTSYRLAFAQEGKGISIDTFKPSSSVNSIFELTLPEPKEHLKWSVGGMVSYAHEPMRREITDPVTGDFLEETFPVKLRTSVDLYGALGVFGFAEIGLTIPVVAYQNGEGSEPGGNIQPAGIGDPRLELKARFLEAHGLSMGAGAIVTFPIGYYASSGNDMLGSRSPTVEPRILADAVMGPVILAFNGGFLVRKEELIGDYNHTHALTWNIAAALDVFEFGEPGGLRVAVETNGEAGIDFNSLTETPIEALFGVKYRLQNDLILTMGAGPGISNAVGTPAFRIFAGITFDSVLRNCPAGPEDFDGFEDNDKCIDPDNDQDGLLDSDDECPNDSEDMDKFNDDDGCPDEDNDGDNIPDTRDKCPMIHEDFDDFQDNDGCPEEGPGKPTVKITDSQLLISSKIYFDFDKATIKEVSYPILDAVAEALLANPHIKKIRVEGHTDNEGTEEYNLQLSEGRAKAVVDYLADKKVLRERLTYVGYGFTKPKASNRTQEGKAINRRVEFTIFKKE